MTQTVETPEKEDNQEIHELSESGPMWKKTAQLVGDEEQLLPLLLVLPT